MTMEARGWSDVRKKSRSKECRRLPDPRQGKEMEIPQSFKKEQGLPTPRLQPSKTDFALLDARTVRYICIVLSHQVCNLLKSYSRKLIHPQSEFSTNAERGWGGMSLKTTYSLSQIKHPSNFPYFVHFVRKLFFKHKVKVNFILTLI